MQTTAVRDRYSRCEVMANPQRLRTLIQVCKALQVYHDQSNFSLNSFQIAEISIQVKRQVMGGELDKVREFTAAELAQVKAPRAYYQDAAAVIADAAHVLEAVALHTEVEVCTWCGHECVVCLQPRTDDFMPCQNPPSQPTAPQVDEDGFQTVTRKKRKKVDS